VLFRGYSRSLVEQLTFSNPTIFVPFVPFCGYSRLSLAPLGVALGSLRFLRKAHFVHDEE
jgi:hypothetical protein